MTDREELERLTNGPRQRTNWMQDEPCPRCDGMTLAGNGTGSVWCIDKTCGYVRFVKRSRTP